MKRSLVGLLLLAALGSHAQTRAVLNARPELKAVTLYLNRAELTHQGSLALPAGTSRVQLGGLSDYEAGSLEVQLGEGAELITVGPDDEGGEIEAVPLTAANRAAADSLNRNRAEQRRIAAELKGLEEERAFLQANRTLSAGTQAGWTAEVQRGAAYVRTRQTAIQLEIERRQDRAATLNALGNELARRAEPTQPAGRQVQLTVRTTRAAPVPLTVRYALAETWCWQPELDIRAKEAGQKVDFITTALLRNTSSITWQRVKLTLVNQQLESNVSKPQMEPWVLGFNGETNATEGRVDKYVVNGTAAGRATDVMQSNRYEVPAPVTLKPGGYRNLRLSSIELAGQPEYLALPKMTDRVFRQTKITGWEGLQLPDSAQVFYRGTYVGRTEIDSRAYNDSLEVSLGYDERIVVGRAKLEDYTRKSALSGNLRVHLLYELNVRNLHPEPVRLKIQDQAPVASDKEIEVKMSETSGAQLDERTGRLTWNLLLPANSSQKLKFGFDIEYPSKRNVSVFRRRTRISSPKMR